MGRCKGVHKDLERSWWLDGGLVVGWCKAGGWVWLAVFLDWWVRPGINRGREWVNTKQNISKERKHKIDVKL